MDGNFSAEHLKMRRPEDDVILSDGDDTYKKHLAVAIEHKEVRDRLLVDEPLDAHILCRNPSVTIIAPSTRRMQIAITLKPRGLAPRPVRAMGFSCRTRWLISRKARGKWFAISFVHLHPPSDR